MHMRTEATFLEESGFQVLTASNGGEALKVASGFHGIIHLLLTDIVMPRMNGRILAERLLAKLPGMNVLYLSAHTQLYCWSRDSWAGNSSTP